MTLANETVVVRRDLKNGVLWVNDVKVAKANVLTSNGVQHVLEGVSGNDDTLRKGLMLMYWNRSCLRRGRIPQERMVLRRIMGTRLTRHRHRSRLRPE